jgi:hypothetical protein
MVLLRRHLPAGITCCSAPQSCIWSRATTSSLPCWRHGSRHLSTGYARILPTPGVLALSGAFGVAVLLASPLGVLLWLMRPLMRRAVQEGLSSSRAAIDPLMK